MEKLTKNQTIDIILQVKEIAENPVLVAFLNHEKELNAKKNSNRGTSKTQKENAPIKENIVKFLTDNTGKGFSATDIANEIGITQNKCTALLTQLKNENKVVRTPNGRKVMFHVGELVKED